jgi:hypothetical protein
MEAGDTLTQASMRPFTGLINHCSAIAQKYRQVVRVRKAGTTISYADGWPIVPDAL